MSKDLKLQLILSTLDKATAPLKKIMGASTATSKTLKLLNGELKDLNRKQETIGQFRELHKGLQGTKRQLQEAQQRVAGLAREMQQAGTPSKTLSRQFDAAKRNAAALTATARQQGLQLQGLRNSLNTAGISTKNLSAHERDLRSQITSTNAKMSDQQKILASRAARQQRIDNAQEHVGKVRAVAGNLAMAGAGSVAAGVAMGKPLSATIREFAKAENSATQLKVALMRVGGEVPPEFEKINALAMKLGDRLPGATSDFQDMMTMLNRQGIQASTILGGMGEAAAYLGVLLKKTPAETAEFAAKLQDATRTAESDMLDLMDVIQRTFYLGVDDNNMLEAFARLSPAMDTIRIKGLEASKVLAPLLVMADQSGLVGGKAGNAFRKVFQLSMNKEKIAAANKLMGKNGKLDFTDGKGEFGGLDNMFEQFKKLKNLSTQTREAIIGKIFGDDAETKQAITTMIAKGIEGYREVQQKMEAQATLQERVNVQLGTLTNLWDATSGTFTNALVSLGESIAPEVKAITEWLGELAQKLGTWAKENPRLANIILKTAAVLGILLVTIGGLLLAVAAIIGPYAMMYVLFAKLGIGGGLLTTVFGGLGKGVMFLGRSIIMLGQVLMANPILAIITAIAVAALLIYTYWEPIKAFFSNLWGNIETFLATLPPKFFQFGADIINGLINGISSGVKKVVDKIKSFGALIAETFQASQDMHSPSRLFESFGGYMTEGLAIGIDRGQFAPINKIKSLSDQLGNIAGDIRIDRSAGTSIQLDKRPPLSAGKTTGIAPAGQTHIEIHIHPPPGMDPNAIAQAVSRELDQRERNRAARMRSSYVDYD